MSNPIKYSTGTESLALKKGNFYIGTGDVGKGPTSTTGYYNGITPPEGGYTIYLNKESGGPSIYTASNDAQLISLTNSIAGQSYTTANECLVYFAGQTDKMVLNRNYEGIVTNGLVLNLDAGFTPSYPKSGTSIYDVSINTNNGTLINGPTFSGGSIVFDGVDDYITGSTEDSSTYTLNIWINITTYTVGGGLFGGSNSGIYIQLGGGNTWQFFNAFVSNVGPTLGQWVNIVGVKTQTQDILYRNSSLISANTTSNTNLGTSYKIARRFDGVSTNCRVGIAQIYNRALTATEVLQNYNAQKGRFGL
jgi:hypothetical protein